MKIKTKASVLWYIASSLSFAASLLTLIFGDRPVMGILWLSLGAIDLALGSITSRKEKSEFKEDEEEKENE